MQLFKKSVAACPFLPLVRASFAVSDTANPCPARIPVALRRLSFSPKNVKNLSLFQFDCMKKATLFEIQSKNLSGKNKKPVTTRVSGFSKLLKSRRRCARPWGDVRLKGCRYLSPPTGERQPRLPWILAWQEAQRLMRLLSSWVPPSAVGILW